MDINAIVKSLEGCPCGRKHTADIKAVEIGKGLVKEAGAILSHNNFPRRILIVADRNTMHASEGILESLNAALYNYTTKIYDNMRTADMKEVEEVERLCTSAEGILSVGSGSLNDICRLAAYRQKKAFAIFATAPSMDGFASGTSPITCDNFKETYQARQPDVIIADTDILANAPAELKSAGFGDMIAKLIALVDWKVSNLTTGEHYCPRIAGLTEQALKKMTMLADKVTKVDSETAGAIMEALVLTGIAMRLEDSVRPASGAEHIISHYWEIKKLEKGLSSDYHGKKTGVATIIVNRIYKELASHEDITPHVEKLDWDKIYSVYGSNFAGEVSKANSPTVTTETTPEKLKECWKQIRKIVNEDLPGDGELIKMMKAAGAAMTLKDIAVEPELGIEGVAYHPYMRHRMTIMRLIPMIGINIDFKRFIS